MDLIQGSLTHGSDLAFLTVVTGRRVASNPVIGQARATYRRYSRLLVPMLGVLIIYRR